MREAPKRRRRCHTTVRILKQYICRMLNIHPKQHFSMQQVLQLGRRLNLMTAMQRLPHMILQQMNGTCNT